VEWISPAKEDDDDFGQVIRGLQTPPPVQAILPRVPVWPNVPEPRTPSVNENVQGPVVVDINEGESTQGVPVPVAPLQPVQPVQPVKPLQPEPPQNNDDESTVASGTGPRRYIVPEGVPGKEKEKQTEGFLVMNG
jgi:hypothetical protein